IKYLCQSPKINDATQEPENCKDLVAWVEITAWAQKQFQKRSSVNTVCCYITKCKIKPYWAIEERKHTKLVISTQYPKASIHEAMDDLLNGEGTIVECYPAPNVSCVLPNGNTYKFSGAEVGFNKSIPCRNVSTYSYKVAVALSLFLGWLGADRFYLGYPALGLLKFCTVGFCGIGSLVDFMLISMQIVGPSDGSDYIVDYYGARLVEGEHRTEKLRSRTVI
ncbi:hypothetical protein NFI96_031202, partial [Prochilodus magdalenae]